MTKIRIDIIIPEKNPYENETLMDILNDLSAFEYHYTCTVIKEREK